MKNLSTLLRKSIGSLLLLGVLAGGASAAPKSYQVTGQVLEVTDGAITVQTVKGKEKWQLERSAATTVKGEAPKVGDKVTIEYTMNATTIETKTAEKPKAPAKK